MVSFCRQSEYPVRGSIGAIVRRSVMTALAAEVGVTVG